MSALFRSLLSEYLIGLLLAASLFDLVGISTVQALAADFPTNSRHESNGRDALTLSRRKLFSKTSMAITGTAFGYSSTMIFWGTVAPQPALALKPKNEQLCGTGFFTNIWEYRCTDIGDISDEGTRIGFGTKVEEGAADSLMAKFNLEGVKVDDGNNKSSTGKSDANISTLEEIKLEKKNHRSEQ